MKNNALTIEAFMASIEYINDEVKKTLPQVMRAIAEIYALNKLRTVSGTIQVNRIETTLHGKYPKIHIVMPKARGVVNSQTSAGIIPQVVADVAAGLAGMHSVGVLHGDVKPDNIVLDLVDGFTRATLIDFGLSIVQHPDGRYYGWDTLYAAPFRPPEIRYDDSVKNSSVISIVHPGADIYAFGICVGWLIGIHAFALTTYTNSKQTIAQWSDELEIRLPLSHPEWVNHAAEAMCAKVSDYFKPLAKLAAMCLVWDPCRRPTAAECAEYIHREYPGLLSYQLTGSTEVVPLSYQTLQVFGRFDNMHAFLQYAGAPDLFYRYPNARAVVPEVDNERAGCHTNWFARLALDLFNKWMAKPSTLPLAVGAKCAVAIISCVYGIRPPAVTAFEVTSFCIDVCWKF